MRSILPLFLAAAAAAQDAPPSADSVYFFPMNNALDQYVANRITKDKVFRVVTEPKRAGAVFTDKLGEDFEKRMMELYPSGPADTEKSETAANKDERPKYPFQARARGTIFLVDVHTRGVIWSLYEPPRNSRPDEMNRAAERIVKRLKQDLHPKP
jgi:hypothetical protein